MKKLIFSLLLLAIGSIAVADSVKISDLTLGSGAASNTNDALPYFDVNTFTTKRLKLSDIINIPSISGAVGSILPSQAGNSGKYLSTDGFTASWQPAAATLSLGPFGTSPNSNAATLISGVLALQPADATNPGGVSTTTQSIAGNKTLLGSTSIYDTGFFVNAVTPSKKFAFDLSQDTASTTLTLQPLLTQNTTLKIRPTVDATGNLIVQNGTSNQIFIGNDTTIGGANSGIQYSDATTANRAQIKLHSYINATSVAGVSTLTSRSGTVAVNAAVVAGQDYSKWTAQAAATTPGSAPISGTFAFKANTLNSLTVPSDFHLQLTNLAGTLGDRLYITSEALTGINESAPGAQLQVTNTTAATVGQILKGATSQSADYLDVKDSTNVVLASINSLGEVSAPTVKALTGAINIKGTSVALDSGAGSTPIKISGVANGTATNDAVNKSQLDAITLIPGTIDGAFMTWDSTNSRWSQNSTTGVKISIAGGFTFVQSPDSSTASASIPMVFKSGDNTSTGGTANGSFRTGALTGTQSGQTTGFASFLSGNAVTANNNTGGTLLRSGSVSGTGNSGTTTVQTGTATNGSTGNVIVISGNNTSATLASGFAQIGSGTNTGGAGTGAFAGFTGDITTTGTSGAMTYNSGNNSGSAGATGALTFNSGNISGSQTAQSTGQVLLKSGNVTSTGNHSGNVLLRSGTSIGTGNTGVMQLSSGSAVSGHTGDVTAISGSNSSSSFPTGAFQAGSGDNSGSAGSGPVNIFSGAETATGTTGLVTVASGDNSGSAGATGALTINSGNITGTQSLLSSGVVTLKSGDAAIDTNASGNVIITSGSADTLTGDVGIATGTSTNLTSSASGNISISTGDGNGSASSTSGNISLSTGFPSNGAAGAIALSTGVDGTSGIGGLISLGGRTAIVNVTDSTTTGALATIPFLTSSVIDLTDGSLTSVSKLGTTAQATGTLGYLINRTGASFTLKHNVGGSNGFFNRTAADMTLANGQGVLYIYLTDNLWHMIGI